MEMSYSGVLAPHLRREMPDAVEQLRVLPRRSWKLVGLAGLVVFFDLVKHPGWIVDFLRRPDRLDKVSAIFWTFVAIVWLFAFIGEFLGTEIWRVSRGELIVSRGIGPVRRSWRFRLDGIADLVSDGPANEGQARPKLHYILFRPKVGAVRFAYEGKTIAFAEWLDEAEGEQIVRWLKPKLPRSAGELVLGEGYAG